MITSGRFWCERGLGQPSAPLQPRPRNDDRYIHPAYTASPIYWKKHMVPEIVAVAYLVDSASGAHDYATRPRFGTFKACTKATHSSRSKLDPRGIRCASVDCYLGWFLASRLRSTC